MRLSTIMAVTSAAFGIALSLAPSASGAPTYASPDGESTDACTALDPCDIKAAIAAVELPELEVILQPGTYDLDETYGAPPNNSVFLSTSNVHLHGQAGKPRPVLTSSTPSFILTVAGPGASLSRVNLESAGRGLHLQGNGTSVSSVEVIAANSPDAPACQFGVDVTATDTSCAAGGAGTTAIAAFPGSGETVLKNVTAASGAPGSIGLSINANVGSSSTLAATNVISSGAATDVKLSTSGAGSSATANFSGSNYSTVSASGDGTETVTPPGTGTNQSSEPLFADLAGLDVRQAPGSPTINAGVAYDPASATDFEDDARLQAGAIDIGADEAEGTPPETNLLSGPGASTEDRTPTFSFSSSEAGTFVCSVDSMAVACSGAGTHTTTTLANGPHAFSVAARDPFGNLDPTPASAAFTVAGPDPDTVAPSIAIDKGPRRKTRRRRAKLVFSSEDATATFACALDGGASVPCTSPVNYRKLRRGKHRFSVRATDPAGNSSPPSRFRWRVRRPKSN